MVGIDTNVLIRYLVNDDNGQHQKASDFFASLSTTNKGYVCLIVFVETIWVLKRVYGLQQEQIVEHLSVLLESSQLSFQNRDILNSVLSSDLKGADLADAIINRLSLAVGCSETKTFDKAAAKLDGMTLL
jgi:predicted nucleic-acid-binding protein